MLEKRYQTDFARSFSKLVTNWKVPEDKAQDLMGEYCSIYEEIGAERFNRAAHSILHTSSYQYFPTIAEFRGYVPAKAKAYCDKCESGWIRVPDSEATRLYGDAHATAVVRCPCRRKA